MTDVEKAPTHALSAGNGAGDSHTNEMDELAACRSVLDHANKSQSVWLAVAQADAECDLRDDTSEIVDTRHVTDIVSWYEGRSQYHNRINRILRELEDDGLLEREKEPSGQRIDNRLSDRGREIIEITGADTFAARLAKQRLGIASDTTESET